MEILPFTQKVHFDALNPTRTALLIVDMNVDFSHESGAMCVPAAAEIVAPIQRLAQTCRDRQIPVVYAIHAHREDGSDMGLTGRYREPIWERKALIQGTPGVTLHPELLPMQGDIVFQKQRHDAFYGTELELILRNLKVESLMISGTVTQVCCESTVRSAFFRDIIPVLITDGVAPLPLPDVGYGTFSAEEVQRFTFTKLGAVYAKLGTASEVSGWLTGVSEEVTAG